MKPEIDWSKAPEGATHYGEVGGLWYKIEGDSISTYRKGFWSYRQPLKHYADVFSRFIPRPQSIDGEGREPIIKVIELSFKDCFFGVPWGDEAIPPIGSIAFNESGVPYNIITHVEQPSASSDYQFLAVGQMGSNGPLRMAIAEQWHRCTPEQIAAEEHREKYMKELTRLWNEDTSQREFLEIVYRMILGEMKL